MRVFIFLTLLLVAPLERSHVLAQANRAGPPLGFVMVIDRSLALFGPVTWTGVATDYKIVDKDKANIERVELLLRTTKGLVTIYLSPNPRIRGVPLKCKAPSTADDSFEKDYDICNFLPNDIVLGKSLVRLSVWFEQYSIDYPFQLVPVSDSIELLTPK